MIVFIGHFAVSEYMTADALDNYLRLMPNELYSTYTVAITYKTWPYLQTFNQMISRAFETGLQYNWEYTVKKIVAPLKPNITKINS